MYNVVSVYLHRVTNININIIAIIINIINNIIVVIVVI